MKQSYNKTERKKSDVARELNALTNNMIHGYETYSHDIDRFIKNYEETATLPSASTPEGRSLLKLAYLTAEYMEKDASPGFIGRLEDKMHERTQEPTLKALKILFGKNSIRALHDSLEAKTEFKLKKEMKYNYLLGEAALGIGLGILYYTAPDLIDTVKNYTNPAELVKDTIPVLTGMASLGAGTYSSYKGYIKEKKLTEKLEHITTLIYYLAGTILNKSIECIRK